MHKLRTQQRRRAAIGAPRRIPICRRKHPSHRGSASVELAVCLPLIVTLVMGTIECMTMIFVKQSLVVVAHESARSSIKSDATATDVRDHADQLVVEQRLNGAQVAFAPADIETLTRGQAITVTVTAPAAQNAPFPLTFFSGDLTAVAVMNRE